MRSRDGHPGRLGCLARPSVGLDLVFREILFRQGGMEEATLEIIRGVCSHYEQAGQATPDYVTKAVEAVTTFARRATYEKSIYRYQARLWIFGDAIGAACWRKGYDICKAQMTPRDDKIHVALSMNELLHLTAMAHLGFK